MYLKYYLRGLGMGIIVTTLIMSIAMSGKKETLSDSEIIERAKALGMTEESTRLADAASAITPSPRTYATPTPETAATPTPTPEAAATPSPRAAATPSPRAYATPTPRAAATPTPEAAATPSPRAAATPSPEAVPETGTISIQVSSGDGSYTVSRKLEEAGLVVSASDFDRYLCENGYDKRINVGGFEIPKNAGPEQIARILAGLE